MKKRSLFVPDLIRKTMMVLSVFVVAYTGYGQDRCGTVEYQKNLLEEKGIPEREADFELWLAKKRLSQKKRTGIQSIMRIPVVVHVIHNGESIGSGTNIPKNQILSQISVLNKDFNRLNGDASQTPSEFAAVAGSMAIEFVLAKRTPEGLPTDGIVRVKGNKSSWNMYTDNVQLKSLSYWPSENYLNIWVCNLSSVLGYAQFPVSDLPGLEAYQNGIATTDGAVFYYKAFGSIDDGSFSLDAQYNKGRTTTHEIGHFFGLRHIWGDDTTCSGTDYTDDTPNQRVETFNKPTHPLSDNCSAAIMFQNYMDYSDDAVMNLFTQDQIDRMMTVLENSPRRTSLLTSPGLLEPEPVGNDIAITDVASPANVFCDATVVPKFTIQNVGTTLISSFNLRYQLDNGSVLIDDETYSAINLPEDAEMEITMDPMQLEPGVHILKAEIIDLNGFDDSTPANNQINKTFAIHDAADRIPLREQFENGVNESWMVINPAGGMNWEITDLSTSHALWFNAYNNVVANDESWLVSPVLDLTTISEARLFFDLSYAYRTNGDDQFRILASTDCGETFDQVLYSEVGQSFANGRVSSSSWSPTDETQWNTKSVSLSSLLSQADVRIAFVATNDNGNNIYLDNIEFFTSSNPEPLEITHAMAVYPNPTEDQQVTVTLNLAKREEAQIEVIDALGKVKYTTEIPDALNQTFTVSLDGSAPGLFFMRLRTPSLTKVVKFVAVK